MKLKDIYEEMLNISRNIGITVRKDSGNFKSGKCIIDGSEYIILNRSNPLEILANVLAGSLSKHTNSIYIKPVVREYIENESVPAESAGEYSLEIKY